MCSLEPALLQDYNAKVVWEQDSNLTLYKILKHKQKKRDKFKLSFLGREYNLMFFKGIWFLWLQMEEGKIEYLLTRSYDNYWLLRLKDGLKLMA